MSRHDDDPLAALERRHTAELAAMHRAVAAAQDRSYWLDRLGIDLNVVMRRPGALQAVKAWELLGRARTRASLIWRSHSPFRTHPTR